MQNSYLIVAVTYIFQATDNYKYRVVCNLEPALNWSKIKITRQIGV